jgi:hypothetical protein
LRGSCNVLAGFPPQLGPAQRVLPRDPLYERQARLANVVQPTPGCVRRVAQQQVGLGVNATTEASWTYAGPNAIRRQ